MKSYIKQKWMLLLGIVIVWMMNHVYYVYLSPVHIQQSDIYYMDFFNSNHNLRTYSY